VAAVAEFEIDFIPVEDAEFDVAPFGRFAGDFFEAGGFAHIRTNSSIFQLAFADGGHFVGGKSNNQAHFPHLRIAESFLNGLSNQTLAINLVFTDKTLPYNGRSDAVGFRVAIDLNFGASESFG